MVREHEDELGTNNDQIKMDRIQQRFPNDDLQLRDYSPQNLRSLSTRRKSAPGAVLFKTLGKSKSASNLWSSNSMGKKEMDTASSLRHSSNLNRQFILEGHAEFASGLQTQDRYLFLFNDLLLVAKQKSSTTFKLKHRIRVCEMWLATCIYDVSDVKLPADRSFVIGWPTVNMVAIFKSTELKEVWLNKLNETIELERMKEANKSVKIKIHSRDMDQTCTLEVTNQTTAKDVLIQCIGKFHITDSDHNESQLWVKTGKDESPYPLIGHELPHSIKSSHLRDLANTDDPMVSLDLEQGMDDVTGEKKCEFIFKHGGKFAKKLSYDESSKGVKKNKKSPLMNLFKRNKDDKNNNSTPLGKFFGHPLQNAMEISFPKAVLEILRMLFLNGPYTKGIFRKSCNAKLSRELHEKLDEGVECINEDTPTLVVGALLKDYLRSLPHCLLVEDYYDDWMALSEEMDSPEKQNKVRELIEKLPDEHRALLKHLLCVLYYIDKRNDDNMMTSYNLAVCITPSILWTKSPKEPPKVIQMTKTPTAIVQYLIDNCAELMGEDTLYLFGDPMEHKVRQDSSTDSDSMHSVLSMPDSAGGSNFRRDDSSIDSLERDLYMAEIDSSPNLAKNHISPSSLSRDSGLYSSQENLDTAKSRGTTLVKSQSGSHLYFNTDDSTYVTEIDIHPSRVNQNRLQRQKSLAESTPPTSPQSKLSSYSSFDSSLTESSSSYFRQFSTNTDTSEQWFTAEESLRGSFDSRESHDDSSLSLHHSSGSSSISVPKSVQNVRYLVSPPASPKSSRKSNFSDSHPSLSERRSYPLSLSTTSLEKSGEPYPSRYGQSAIDLCSSATNVALKELSMYSTSLGSSPPPHKMLHNFQKNCNQKRESSNLPMRASYDSAIISQVTENETYRSELHKKQFTPVSKSESESDVNKTLTNSPDTPTAKPRPEKPPSYDEAVKRKNMIKSGKLPNEITEQDIKKEKEASEKAKQIYQESLRKYQQEADTPKTEEKGSDNSEEESEDEEEDVYVCLKNPRLIYEESMKKYEEQNYKRPSPSKDPVSVKIENKHLSVPMCNLHRSYSDSGEYANSKEIVTQRRDPSPKPKLSTPQKREGSPITRLSHSSSSVSNSSSDTVTDTQQVSPIPRERSESSPVSARHQFQTTSPSTFTAQYSHKNSAQLDSSSDRSSRTSSRESIVDNHSSRKLLSQSQDFSLPQKSESSARTSSYRDSSSVTSKFSTPRSSSAWGDVGSSPRKDVNVQEVNQKRNLSKSLDFQRIKETSKIVETARDLATSHVSRGRETSVKRNPYRDSYPSANLSISRTPDSSLSSSRESSENRKSKRSQDLPWSVKSLKQIYDQGGLNQTDSKVGGSRPPPPPYQPPPPFRRPDDSRMSSSSQSSVGSGSTGRSTPPVNRGSSQRRSGGPQSVGYSSADDSDVSYV